MKNNPKVSIIVPVFNREETIVPCIKSILQSEFTDFEILIIDDGSTDSTKKECEQLAKRDNRISFISKSNEGVSVARNVGLSKAKGEWITFVDSDEAIMPCHLNVMNHRYDNDVDLVMTNRTNGRIINHQVRPYGTLGSIKDFVFAESAAAYLFNEFKPFKNPVFHVCNKFFRRSILENRNILFDTTMSLGEDQVFLCEYLKYAKGLVHYNVKSYVQVSWPNLVHLGVKLRTPADYLYNQRKNYEVLCSIIDVGGVKQNCMQ